MLKTEQNTPEVNSEIWGFIYDDEKLSLHQNVNTYFEHGQWWVSCNDCGAAWSVVDAIIDNEEIFDFEEVSAGDEYCLLDEVR